MTDGELSLDQETLKHRLTDLPEHIIKHIHNGFHLISRGSEDQRQRFFNHVMSSMETRSDIDKKEASKLIGLNEKTISDAVAAVMVVTGSIVDLSVDKNDFFTLGGEKLFADDHKPVAEQLLDQILLSKDSIKDGMKEGALANAVLPSFRALSLEIDLRVGFSEDGELEGQAPLAVALLSLDCGDDTWFQLTHDEIDRIIEKLQRVSSNLKQLSRYSLTLKS